MRMEIVVDTTDELILIENWLMGQFFPGKMQIDIYNMQDSKTYFYSTQYISSKWILAAEGS